MTTVCIAIQEYSWLTAMKASGSVLTVANLNNMKYLSSDDDIITVGSWLSCTSRTGEVAHIDYINEQVYVTDGADNWIMSKDNENLTPLKFEYFEDE